MWTGHVVHMDRGIRTKTCNKEPLGDLDGRGWAHNIKMCPGDID
jgi:hypothetical protein